LLAAGLLVATGALFGSVPARADSDGGGADNRDGDYGSDHDGVYQAQRGEAVCESREACGGDEAIPMNQPGLWYRPADSRRR
jgi:hypothetical protein